MVRSPFNNLMTPPTSPEFNNENVIPHDNVELGNEHLFRKTYVETTRYGLDLSNCRTIRMYKIQLWKKSAGVLKNMQMYPQIDVIKIERQNLLQRILTEFLATENFPNKLPLGTVIFDRKKYIYTAYQIPDETTTELKFNYIQNQQLKADIGSRTESIIMKLTFVKKFKPQETGNGHVTPEDIKIFLHCLMMAQACKKEYLIFGGYACHATEETSFVKGKVLKDGVSVTIEETSEDNKKFMMTLNPTKVVFHRGIPLVDYACRELATSVDKLEEVLRSKESKAKILKKLTGLYVSTQNKIYFPINGLQKSNEFMFYQSAPQLEVVCIPNFVVSDTAGVQYPGLPLIVRKQDNVKCYYPIEQLVVPKGQRVIFNESNEELINQVLEKQKMQPLEHKQVVSDFKRSILGSDNKFLRNFGVCISSNAITFPARTAIPPQIDYMGSCMEPSVNGAEPTLFWDAKPHTRFLRPIHLSKWAILVLDNCVSREECTLFADYFKMASSHHGMKIETESEVLFCDSTSAEELRAHAQLLKENGSQFLMVAAEVQNKEMNDLLATLEVTTGLNTHLFTKDVIVQGMDGKAPALLTLPLQVINAKCGAQNFTVAIPRGVVSNNKSNDRLICKNLRRMYVGLSVANGDDQKPKAIGMAYTTSDVTDLNAMIWYQRNRLRNITELQNKMVAAIKHYEEINRCQPIEIVVYRNYSTEAETDKLANEFNEIKEARTIVGRDYRPTITMVSVCRERNPRFLRTKITSTTRQNVAPGLVVDINQRNPKEGFYVVSNMTEKGTSMSVCYNVVGNHAGYTAQLKIDEIKWLTNALCYGNQFSNSPGPVPSIVTAAENVASRALAAAEIAIKEFAPVNAEKYYEELTDRVKGRVEGRHWWY